MTRTCLVLILAIAAPAGAQQAPTGLTLDDAIARGLAASHRLEEAAAITDANEARVVEHRAATLPQVSVRGAYTRTNHVDEFGVRSVDGTFRTIYPDVPDNYSSRLDLQWSVWAGGRTEAIERAARIDVDAGLHDTNALKADLVLEITRAYWTLVTALDAERVMTSARVRTDAQLRDARNQLAAGVVGSSDVSSALAQDSRQAMRGIQARTAREDAEADLAGLIGAPPGTRLEPDPAGAADSAALPPVELLVLAARAARPERAALMNRLAAARAREDAARAGTHPIVSIGGGVDVGHPNPRIFPREARWQEAWDASVNVHVPLFDGGRTRAQTAQASAQVRALEARLAEFDSLLDVEIARRVRDVEANRAVIAAADTTVTAAADAHRVARNRFAAGVATTTDVIVAVTLVLIE